MLTVKVEKSEHGGYIAKQEGDSPLRYIAAAGETEAAAVSALFDYHADLIRKGRIEVSEVIRGTKPGSNHSGALVFNLEQYAPNTIPTKLWEYILPISQGLREKPPQEQLDNLICRVVKGCFVNVEPDYLLNISKEVTKWLKVAISCRNESTWLKNHRTFRRAEDCWSDSMAVSLSASTLLYNKRHNIKPFLHYVESQVVDFLECLLMMTERNGEEEVRIPTAIDLSNQYLLAVLNQECSIDLPKCKREEILPEAYKVNLRNR